MRLNLDGIDEIQGSRSETQAQTAQRFDQAGQSRPLLTHRLLHNSGEALITLGLRLKKLSNVHSEQELMPGLWEDIT